MEKKMSVPQDCYILLSYINTKLRSGADLEDLCYDNDISFADLCKKLEGIGYIYDKNKNAFVKGV